MLMKLAWRCNKGPKMQNEDFRDFQQQKGIITMGWDIGKWYNEEQMPDEIVNILKISLIAKSK